MSKQEKSQQVTKRLIQELKIKIGRYGKKVRIQLGKKVHVHYERCLMRLN